MFVMYHVFRVFARGYLKIETVFFAYYSLFVVEK